MAVHDDRFPPATDFGMEIRISASTLGPGPGSIPIGVLVRLPCVAV